MSSIPQSSRFGEVFAAAKLAIEQRWQVPVRISDVPDPFTGDLDGGSIAVDYAVDEENALFILVHLFGHTVQWNTSQRAREIGMLPPSRAWTEQELSELDRYERQACGYSLQLLLELGASDLHQWISDFAACDSAYLLHFYRTGEKKPFRAFWRENSPLISALPIPEFYPTAWTCRADGTVI